MLLQESDFGPLDFFFYALRRYRCTLFPISLYTLPFRQALAGACASRILAFWDKVFFGDK